MNIANNQVQNSQLTELSKNLNNLMFDRDVDSKKLSQLTGISINTINALKRGEGNPTLGTLFALAKFFNCSIDVLVGINNEKLIKKTMQTIPVYNLSDTEKRNKISIIEHIIEDCGSFNDHELFAVKIHNNIFSPFFEKGTIFIVSQDIKHTDGDLVLLALKDSSIVIRKIFNLGDKEIIFSSISLEPEFNKYQKYTFLGVVIKIINTLY